MARLFGFIGNRSDLGSRVLDVDAEALTARADGERLGWGVGFYQAGEVLLRRRPMDDRDVIEPTGTQVKTTALAAFDAGRRGVLVKDVISDRERS